MSFKRKNEQTLFIESMIEKYQPLIADDEIILFDQNAAEFIADRVKEESNQKFEPNCQAIRRVAMNLKVSLAEYTCISGEPPERHSTGLNCIFKTHLLRAAWNSEGLAFLRK